MEHFPNKNNLHHLKTEDIASRLISIKGVGNWTIEMFMMFHMLAPNILPLGDIGLIKGFAKHYGISDKNEIINHARKNWSGYSTVATWYLWRSLDPVPVEY